MNSNGVKDVVLISTRKVGGPLFPIDGKVFSVKLATFLIDKYNLNVINLSDEAKIFLDKSESFFTSKEMDAFESSILEDHEDITVVKDIVKRLNIIYNERYAVDDKENNKPIDDSFNQLSSLINEINLWLNNHQKSKMVQSNSISVHAAGINVDNFTTLHDCASFYKYHTDKGDICDNDCLVLGVMELKEPDSKNASDSWDWVNTLEDAIKDLCPNVKRIILLLHDQDLYEFQGQPFHCITFEAKQGTSLAVFRHTNMELYSIFSGTLNSKQVFDELYNLLSSFSKRQENNERNAVSNGYLSLI